MRVHAVQHGAGGSRGRTWDLLLDRLVALWNLEGLRIIPRGRLWRQRERWALRGHGRRLLLLLIELLLLYFSLAYGNFPKDISSNSGLVTTLKH